MKTGPEIDPQALIDEASPTLAVVHPWIRRVTRLGFVARGILYSLIGLLTLWSIVKNGEDAHGGMKSTFTSIQALRPGLILLVGLALGFAGFAVGMMWTAIFNWNFEGRTKLGFTRRAGTFINGLAHVSLAASTVLLIAGHESEQHAERRWTELALSYPFGREGVIIGGLWAIGYGIFLITKVGTGRLDLLLDLSTLQPVQRQLASWIGRFGMLSRGVIYVSMGLVLAFAGLRGDATNVVGFGGAMRTASKDAYGAVTLALIAAGLVAYGIFMFVEARYRRIGEPSLKTARL